MNDSIYIHQTLHFNTLPTLNPHRLNNGEACFSSWPTAILLFWLSHILLINKILSRYGPNIATGKLKTLKNQQ